MKPIDAKPIGVSTVSRTSRIVGLPWDKQVAVRVQLSPLSDEDRATLQDRLQGVGEVSQTEDGVAVDFDEDYFEPQGALEIVNDALKGTIPIDDEALAEEEQWVLKQSRAELKVKAEAERKALKGRLERIEAEPSGTRAVTREIFVSGPDEIVKVKYMRVLLPIMSTENRDVLQERLQGVGEVLEIEGGTAVDFENPNIFDSELAREQVEEALRGEVEVGDKYAWYGLDPDPQIRRLQYVAGRYEIRKRRVEQIVGTGFWLLVPASFFLFQCNYPALAGAILGLWCLVLSYHVGVGFGRRAEKLDHELREKKAQYFPLPPTLTSRLIEFVFDAAFSIIKKVSTTVEEPTSRADRSRSKN